MRGDAHGDERRLQKLKKQATRYCAFTRARTDRFGLDLLFRLAGVSEDLLLNVDMANDALTSIGTLDCILVLGKKPGRTFRIHV
jgi:hypothetical protein